MSIADLTAFRPGRRVKAGRHRASRQVQLQPQVTEGLPRRGSSDLTRATRTLVALGRAGPILGQYLCPVAASCGASWPRAVVRTPLLAIALSELGRVRFPSSAFL